MTKPDKTLVLSIVIACIAIVFAAYTAGLVVGITQTKKHLVQKPSFQAQLEAVHRYMEKGSEVRWVWQQEYCN